MKHHDFTFVAHRGYQNHYPENTLIAINGAYEAGIKHIEFDVLLSSDNKPIIYHDQTLDRISGVSGYVHQHTLKELTQIPASESKRLGDQFKQITITPLSDINRWAKNRPDVHLYVEIKPEILNHCDTDIAVNHIVNTLGDILHQCTFISYSKEILQVIDKTAQKTDTSSPLKTGFVINDSSKLEHLPKTDSLSVIFSDHRVIPPDFDFHSQPVPWVLYEIGDIDTVQKFAELGCTHFESFKAPELTKQVKKISLSG